MIGTSRIQEYAKMLSKEDHKKLLREVDERVLPRRQSETDEAYGKRMYEHFNGAPAPR